MVKSLKKAELIQVAQHYKLEVSTLKKSELKKLVIEYLVKEEVVSEDDIELPPTASPSETSSSLELGRLELLDKERERESQLKLKELQIQESSSKSQHEDYKPMCQCVLIVRRKAMSWLNAESKSTNMSSPIPWLYLTLCNQLLDVELCQHLQRIHSIPLSPRVQFHCHRMENKYQLQSCVTQTLIVEGTLPLSKETNTGTTMFIQGVGLTPVSVPLHTVFLRCDRTCCSGCKAYSSCTGNLPTLRK